MAKHKKAILVGALLLSVAVFFQVGSCQIAKNVVGVVKPERLQESTGARDSSSALVDGARSSRKPDAAQVVSQGPQSISREERLRQIRGYVEFTYGKAILGLGLSVDDTEKVMDWLVARSEAIEITSETYRDTKLEDPKIFYRSMQLTKEAMATELRQAFDAETAEKIAAMPKSSMYILRMRNVVDPALQQAGLPVTTPKQTLELAILMMENYGPLNEKTFSPDVKYDPITNLTEYDDAVIQRAAIILTDQQLPYLKRALISGNLNRRGIPEGP